MGHLCKGLLASCLHQSSNQAENFIAGQAALQLQQVQHAWAGSASA